MLSVALCSLEYGGDFGSFARASRIGVVRLLHIPLHKHLQFWRYLVLDSPDVLLLSQVEASDYLITGLTRILGYKFLLVLLNHRELTSPSSGSSLHHRSSTILFLVPPFSFVHGTISYALEQDPRERSL